MGFDAILRQNQTFLFTAVVGFLFLYMILVVYCLISLRTVKKKSNLFFEGKEAKNFEELVFKNAEDLKSLDLEIQELYNISNQLHVLAQSSIQKVAIIRFNPFGDIGGDQSFSVALLDGKNTGVVISSLHTKEGTRVYAKPIVKGEAEKYPLTEEERNVVKIALQKKPHKV